ncbi:MAG: HAMP domain-containing histidine kinase [Ardenticatenaceae bacterium]|nr:HAMP domain-containing histidine kinase [Ardenticatenaceae bacterium]
MSTAVSMATLSLYGREAGVLVAASALITLSVLSLRANWPGWARAVERIGFNIGMGTISIFLAGTLFDLLNALNTQNLVVQTFISWLSAAIVNDQINLWLLIALLHLQSQADPRKLWHQNKWAIPINVLVMSAGGGVLAFAVEQFDIIGMGIFFLPIVLSAYAFRLYVNQTKQQMERLEELVAARTNDLRAANAELAELHKTKDAYLAVLTHDMRTPLSSIKGYASVLSKGNLAEDQQRHIAKILTRSQDSLMEIVNNILEIENLQSGTPIELDRTDFDLAYLIVLVSETIQAQAREKNISLQYDENPTEINVNGDREKIKRVLTNLIANAVKYTEENGTVTAKARVEDGYAVVDVVDTGYGIPADELPYIFDRFRRVKGHRHIAVGTGLGLAIVKSLVEAHQGQILVTSEEGAGSTFTMKLPLQTDDALVA